MQTKKKGEFGFLYVQRKRAALRTVIFLLLPLAIFVMGYLSTKTKANLLTVIAVVGLLPACKSLVNVIMLFTTPKFDIEVYNQVNDTNVRNTKILYSLFMTSQEGNYPISCIAVKNSTIIGYSEFEKFKAQECIKHIQSILSQNAIKNVTVAFLPNIEKFRERLVQLDSLENSSAEKDMSIAELLLDISLE